MEQTVRTMPLELSEDELLLMEEERKVEEEARRTKLIELGLSLQTKLGKAVEYKSPIEVRMLQDEAQYWGNGQPVSNKDDVSAGKRGESTMPVDNKTRSKTRIAAARIGDMLFPSSTPNWALRPTPYPEVEDAQLEEEYNKQIALIPPPPEGQEPPPPPPPDLDALADAVAEKACRRMTRRISDVLSESGYPKHGRAAISEACKLGTGVIKGPYNRGRVQRRYRPAEDEEGNRVDVLELTMEPRPAVARVSVWNFFPMPARNVEECEAAFELHLPTATMLRQMVKSHGFDPQFTAEIIRGGPHRGEVDSLLSQRAAITGNNISYEENWALWEYHGPIPRDALEAWGIPLEEEESELESLYGEVWFCRGLPLRVNLTMLEADSSLPYHVFNYERDETSIFGFGIPFIMRDDQRVIDTLWDAMQYNAAVSAGAQTVISKGLITPADGSYHIRGPKLWYKNDEDISVKDAIEVFTMPSNINVMMPLYEQAKANADENTNLPLMLGDTMGQAPAIPTSGLSMLINQQNIVQRQAAHSWDDDVTGRLLPRLYDWFMQHDDDPSIKGDFEVEVRGASYLLIKDTQAQHAQLLIQLAAQDPGLAQRLNLDALYRVYLGFMDIPVDLLLKTPEQVQREQASAGPDPLQELEMAEKQANIEVLHAKVQEIQQGMQSGGLTEKDVMEAELAYAKLQIQQALGEVQLEIERTRQQTQLLRTAADESIAYEKIQADMEKFYAQRDVDVQLKQRKQQTDEFFKAAELRLSEMRDKMKTINLSRGFDTF